MTRRDPDIEGHNIKMWQYGIVAPKSPGCLAMWHVEAHGHHPIFTAYSICLVHLRPIPGTSPVHLQFQGATHEISIWALDPAAVLRPSTLNALVWTDDLEPLPRIQTPNAVVQFHECRGDASALQRVELMLYHVARDGISMENHSPGWYQLIMRSHPHHPKAEKTSQPVH